MLKRNDHPKGHQIVIAGFTDRTPATCAQAVPTPRDPGFPFRRWLPLLSIRLTVPLPGTLGPLERRRISYVCSVDPASFRVKTEELGRRYRGAVERGGVVLSLLQVRVVRRVLEAYALHPSCGVGQMSAPTVTLGTNSVGPVAMESVTIRAYARPRVGTGYWAAKAPA